MQDALAGIDDVVVDVTLSEFDSGGPTASEPAISVPAAVTLRQPGSAAPSSPMDQPSRGSIAVQHSPDQTQYSDPAKSGRSSG
jgi:hypothetical protein